MASRSFEILVDDEDRGPGDSGKPWSAAFGSAEEGAVAVGTGATPADALRDLLVAPEAQEYLSLT